MNAKLYAIRKIIKADDFIVITNKGFAASTPKMGHKRYWKETQEFFNHIKKMVDKQMIDETTKG